MSLRMNTMCLRELFYLFIIHTKTYKSVRVLKTTKIIQKVKHIILCYAMLCCVVLCCVVLYYIISKLTILIEGYIRSRGYVLGDWLVRVMIQCDDLVCQRRLASVRATYLKFSVKSQTIADYENINYLLEMFLVYNELITIYIPHEKPKN